MTTDPKIVNQLSEIFKTQEYKLIDIESVKAHPENARKGDKSSIAESIHANGFYGSIVVQKSTMYIVAGNHRWMAAKEQGLKQIPAIIIDVDNTTARRILLADNKTNDKAGWNDETLIAVLQTVESNQGSIIGTGFSDEEFAKLLETTEPGPPDSVLNEEYTYSVIIDCDSEEQQKELFEEFEKEGMKCRLLTS